MEREREKKKEKTQISGGRKSLRCTMAARGCCCCCLSGWTLIAHKSEIHIDTSHTHTKKNQATLRRNKNCPNNAAEMLADFIDRQTFILSFFPHSSLSTLDPLFIPLFYISLLWIHLICFSAMIMPNF